ncbi:MAG: HD domain-containing protein [Butyrivibrio sp.]|nr:HD domain-containing protein [Butyrivibrio sp.]
MSEVFAAIDVGSYELALKIFEISPKKGVKELDHIRHNIDLGSETYLTGKISYNHMEELSHVLKDFVRIMKSYGVTHYQAYGTSAMRETANIDIVIEQLMQKSGLHIDVISNSEQRFLDYKSIALKSDEFSKVIEKSTAIVDIGGGSIQISLFDNDKLVATQNLKMGVLRLYSTLEQLNASRQRYAHLISELVNSQLSVFSKMYVKDRKIENIIILDDYVSPIIQKGLLGNEKKGYAKVADIPYLLENMSNATRADITKKLHLSEDTIPLVFVSGILVQCIINMLGAQMLWAPGVTLCDGIAYEYAEKRKMIKLPHDFEQDIIACAQNISKRYMGSKSRSETLQTIALNLFDATKKVHGLSKRDRLLLQIATILHDCGKYISMVNLASCSYNIIMSTEIIGLSHREREIVANVVKFNHDDFEYYKGSPELYARLEHEDYLKLVKLTALLRVTNGLDRTHKQKFKNVRFSLKDNELIITVDNMDDVTLENGLFKNRADFFEEVFGVKPVIRQKRSL